MFRKLLYTFIFTLTFLYAHAQIGIPSIRTFRPIDYHGSTQVWTIGQDDRGLMYFGGNTGLYVFDGQVWHNFDFDSLSPTIRCLQVSGDTIWFGSIGDFGYLLPDLNKGFTYHSLTTYLDSALRYSFSNIWSLKKVGNTVLFQGDTVIFRYNSKTHALDTLMTGNFFFLSVAGDRFVIPDYMKFHIYDPEEDDIQTLKMPIRAWLYHAFQINDSTLLMIVSGNLVYYDLRRNKVKQIVSFKKQIPDLYGTTLYSAILDSVNKEILIGTVEKGIFFLDYNGKLVNHIDKSLGLRSNTVHNMYFDRDGNLWSVHSNGISLIRVNLPFFSVDERLGIDGQPYSVLENDKDLFVGTNLGLYRLYKNRFYPVKDTAQNMTQQVFNLKEFRFSDGKKFIIYPSNSGIYYLDSNYVAHRITGYLGYNIVQSPADPDNIYFISGYHLLKFRYKNGFFGQVQKVVSFTSHYILGEPDRNYLWFSSLYEHGFGFYNILDSSLRVIQSDTNVSGSDYLYGNKYVFFTDRGLFEYDYSTKKFFLSDIVLNEFLKNRDVIKAKRFIAGQYGVIVNKEKNSEFYLINQQDNHLMIDSTLFSIIHGITDFYYHGSNVWLLTDEKFIRYPIDMYCNKAPHFKPLITEIRLNGDSVVYKAPGDLSKLDLKLSYDYNDLTIEYALPSFFADQGVEFSTWLEGRGKNRWSSWSKDTKREFIGIREGKYTFHLKARNEFMQETGEISFTFRVSPPFYRTIWAYLVYLLILLGIIYLIVRWRLNALMKEKEKLEQLVRERTAEIQQQKEEILAQAENLKIINEELKQKNEEIKVVLEQLEQANQRIQQEHKHVTDSITYAKKIQIALIQRQRKLGTYFPENFVLFQPKDVIGGDFYIFERMQDKLVLGLHDATGHGVPGALVSMLAYSFITQILSRNPQTPAEVLEALREELTNIFVGNETKRPIYDGLDMALCLIDPKSHKLLFSGAHMPVIIVRGQDLIELKGSKNFIGYSNYAVPFDNQEIELLDGDKIYLFSDGYYDQFSSEKHVKFYRRNFYKLLISIADLPFDEQLVILQKTFEEWKGDEIQTDDVTVIGVKVDFSVWNKA